MLEKAFRARSLWAIMISKQLPSSEWKRPQQQPPVDTCVPKFVGLAEPTQLNSVKLTHNHQQSCRVRAGPVPSVSGCWLRRNLISTSCVCVQLEQFTSERASKRDNELRIGGKCTNYLSLNCVWPLELLILNAVCSFAHSHSK